MLASVVLHNYLRMEHADHRQEISLDTEVIGTGQVTEGSWRLGPQMTPIEGVPRRANNDAKKVRDDFKCYFNEEGSIPWQGDMI